ncbi:MAG: hypothetical protein KME27_14015 [Lyngbya sp. HA4199-MV5]|jgi:hypothetical protein|nr:hypothetical protein [Lyngbya sp. HA4199-MV5]
MWIDQSQLDSKYGDTLRAYCQLAAQEHLSEQDAERLTEILILAETDEALTFLLNEADHFMAHELGLLNCTDRERYKQQQAELREQIGLQPAAVAHSKIPTFQKLVFPCSGEFRQRAWQVIGC